jgi:hypothetical protein
MKFHNTETNWSLDVTKRSTIISVAVMQGQRSSGQCIVHLPVTFLIHYNESYIDAAVDRINAQ